MANEVIPTPDFNRRLKRFLKKFPSLKQEIAELEQKLLANPTMGDCVCPSVYKPRLGSESKGTGKSGGFRIIRKAGQTDHLRPEQIDH